MDDIVSARLSDPLRPDEAGFATNAVHAGNAIDPFSRAVQRPLVLSSSYLMSADPDQVDWDDMSLPLYTRNTSPNQATLQKKLATLEGGEDAVVLASGVAALHAVFFCFLSSGDHIVLSDTTYEATWRLFTELLPQKYGVEATYVDMGNLHEVRAAVQPHTKLIFTETIANPTTLVSDISTLAAIAHENNALLAVDSTFTPPPFYRPLDDGADLVIHSLTKYINGHGDAMGGAVIGRADRIGILKADAMVDVGGVISPFNAWLINRGAITLPLRLSRHFDSAQKVAEFLDADPRVAYVAYPGLTSHPQHELATTQFGGRGYGGTLAFAVEGDHAAQNTFVENLRLITSAVSLGHPESLIVHVGTDGPRVAPYPEEFRSYGHLRLAIGLEDAEDLIADVDQALSATFPSPS